MNKLKTLLVTGTMAVTALGLGATAFADSGDGGYCKKGGKQGKHSRGGKHDMHRDPEKMLERMAKKLGLDDNQQSQIRNILTAGVETKTGLHEDMQANREQLREAMSANAFDEAKITELANAQGDLKAKMIIERARTKSGIHAILTEEQRSQAASFMEKRRMRK